MRGVANRSARVSPWQLTPTEPPLTLTESLTTGGRATDDDGDEGDDEGEVEGDGDRRGVDVEVGGVAGGEVAGGRADVGPVAALGGVVGRGGGPVEWVGDLAGEVREGVDEVSSSVVGSGLGRAPAWVLAGRAPSVR